MTSTTIVAKVTTSDKKFTISLTKAELDSIQKQFLDELDAMLDKVRITMRGEVKEECGTVPHIRKSYRYDNERDNVTVT